MWEPLRFRLTMAAVLVVDDQPDAGRTLVRLVRLSGHQAEWVSSGRDALEYVSGRVPDLIILDVHMPDMSGLDLLATLRRDARTRHVPIIMFSAASDPKTRQAAMNCGADDYWVKASFEFDRLEQQLEFFVGQ